MFQMTRWPDHPIYPPDLPIFLTPIQSLSIPY